MIRLRYHEHQRRVMAKMERYRLDSLFPAQRTTTPCPISGARLNIRCSLVPAESAIHHPMSLLRSLLRALVITLALIGLLTGCDEPPQPTVNLHRAVHSGDLDQIKRHLFWKTDINQPGADGDYPLHVAVSQGRVVIARELLSHGARIDARDALGRTPLHVALANGKIQAAQLLLERGADDDLQALLLDLANAQALDRDSIELLSARGIDLNAANPKGQTPLHLAVAAANLKLAKQLISAGAKVNLADSSGKTALEIAEEQGEPTMVTLLEQYGAER